MAETLRKAAGGYEGYYMPRQQGGKAKAGKAAAAAPKRLIRREVRSNSEFRRTIAWVFLGMSSVLFLMGITSIFVKAGVSQVNYNINSIRAENEQLLLDNDRVRGQIAELRALDRIEEIARRDLGMIKNETVEYMVLSTTIVSEGKIRALEEEAVDNLPAGADKEAVKALEKVLDAILAILNK
ncbi:MAG: septum formation initiator family protein [Clostridiales bacterium]|nr:septum formation initiator family protein [Clostridiales bacterium]